MYSSQSALDDANDAQKTAAAEVATRRSEHLTAIRSWEGVLQLQASTHTHTHTHDDDDVTMTMTATRADWKCPSHFCTHPHSHCSHPFFCALFSFFLFLSSHFFESLCLCLNFQTVAVSREGSQMRAQRGEHCNCSAIRSIEPRARRMLVVCSFFVFMFLPVLYLFPPSLCCCRCSKTTRFALRRSRP